MSLISSRGRRRECVPGRGQRHRGLADQPIVPQHRPKVGTPDRRRAAKERSKRRPGSPGSGMRDRQAGESGRVKSGSSGHRAGATDRLGAGREPKKAQGPGPARVGLLTTEQRREYALTGGRMVPVSGGKSSASTSRLSAGKPARSRTGDRGRMSGPGPGPARDAPLAIGQRRETARIGGRPARDRGRTADPQAAPRSELPVPVLARGPHGPRAEVRVSKAGQGGSGTAVHGAHREKAAADRR